MKANNAAGAILGIGAIAGIGFLLYKRSSSGSEPIQVLTGGVAADIKDALFPVSSAWTDPQPTVSTAAGDGIPDISGAIGAIIQGSNARNVIVRPAPIATQGEAQPNPAAVRGLIF